MYACGIIFFSLVCFACCLAQERLPWPPCCQQSQTVASPQWKYIFPANISSWFCPGGMELLLSAGAEGGFLLALQWEKQDVRCSSGDGWKKVLMVFFKWLNLFNVSVFSSEGRGPWLESNCVTSVLVRREPPCTKHDWLSLLRCSGSLSKSCFLGLFSLLQPWYSVRVRSPGSVC